MYPAGPGLTLLRLAGTRTACALAPSSPLELRGFWSKCCTIVDRTIRADIPHRTGRSLQNSENSDNSANSREKSCPVLGVEPLLSSCALSARLGSLTVLPIQTNKWE